MNCDFCNKSFSTKGNLISHQKTAKYCLEIQGIEKSDFKCEYCSKTFTVRKVLNEHYRSCKEKKNQKQDEVKQIFNNNLNLTKKFEKDINKYKRIVDDHKKEIAEKDRYIADLKSTIEELKQKIEKFENALISSSKTTTTNNTTTTNHNNIVINSLDLSREKVEKMIENHLTSKVIGQGQVGLALMTYEHLLKDENGNPTYKCVDPARQIFEYVNKDGDVVKDVKANKLIGALVDSKNLGKKTRENAEKLWTDENGNIDNERFNAFVMKSTEISNLESENSKFRSTLTSKTS
jgi:hypothetical protein